jgi:Ca2+-binding RTX toxin-like protein
VEGLIVRRVFLLFAVAAMVVSVVPAVQADLIILSCRGKAATIAGDAGDNLLIGTPGRDVIVALGGDDTIDGRGGNDLICGGDGIDTIDGGGGHDVIFGGAGPDVINGESGRDAISGGRGRDLITGGKGRDVILGNTGNDRMRGNPGGDYIRGDAGTGDIANGGRNRDWCKAESKVSCEGPAGPWRVRATGIGNIDFGTPTDFALVEIALLGDPMLEGAPDEDTGWIDSFSIYGTCPGTDVRMARWGNLRTFFTRDGIADEGEFFTWQLLGSAWGYEDTELATRSGLRVNDTRGQLDMLSSAVTVEYEDIFEFWYFYLAGNPSGISGNLSSGNQGARVTFMQGGIGCGE